MNISNKWRHLVPHLVQIAKEKLRKSIKWDKGRHESKDRPTANLPYGILVKGSKGFRPQNVFPNRTPLVPKKETVHIEFCVLL